MIKKGIGRQIVLHYFIVVFLTLLLVEIIFMFAIRSYYYNSISTHLENYAAWASDYYQKYVKQTTDDNLNDLPDLVQAFELVNTEVEILNGDGIVLTNSTDFQVDKPVQTSDVLQARNGSVSKWIGRQPGTGELVMAVSSPLQVNGGNELIIRYVTSLELVNDKLLNITLLAVIVGLVVLAVVLLFSMGLANSIVRPINIIQAVSSQMAKGDFDVRVKGDYPHELGDLAATLNFMAQEIVRSNELKDDFISSISHELRTPLTGIKGWSETLISGGFDPEETEIGMKIISKETDRLIGLVEEMLDFAKLQSNEMKLVLGNVHLIELLQEVMLNVWAKAEQKQLLLKLDGPVDAPLHVWGDANRLKQIFLNIIDNAIKFSHEGTTIRLDVSKLEEEAVVAIKDTGIGISEENLRKVRDRFFQVNHQGGGTGLGLAITQQLVELHKGTISIDSELGVGTTVTVSLPLMKDGPDVEQLEMDLI